MPPTALITGPTAGITQIRIAQIAAERDSRL